MVVGRRIVMVLGLALLGQPRADASMDVMTPAALGGRGVERGVIEIRCSTDVERVFRLSRGSVLDLDIAGAKRDLVLTAAHGLPDAREAIRRTCRVFGNHGRAYRIKDVWRARANGADIASDWAVLLVDGRLRGEVGRLRPAKVTSDRWSQLAAAEAPVRLVLRQAAATEGDCRLRQSIEPYEYAPTDLMLYACPGSPNRSRAPGLSGSPVVVGVEGRAMVVAIHLGWGLQRFDDGRLHAVSIGRPINAEIAAAIATAAAEARRPSALARRR